MFTGIIQEVGTIGSAVRKGGGVQMEIRAPACFKELKIDDSIAVNGVCLTVVQKRAGLFKVEAVEETLRKTTLGRFGASAKVNLELAMRLSDRLGGHLVLGHVDCTGVVSGRERRQNSTFLTIEIPDGFSRYIIEVGSIAVDGVSLTVASKDRTAISVSLIPHTLECTTLGSLQTRDSVNLEFDLIGKYVEQLLKGRNGEKGDALWLQKLKEWGYI